MPGVKEEILLRVGSGDEAALAELYDETASAVYGLALCVVGDRQRAEAVAVDAFVEVWRTAARFDPSHGSAVSWIMAVAHRHAVRSVRSEPGAAQPDSRQRTAGSLGALDHLPETQRRALTLAYFDGRTCADVSRLMCESSETTVSRLGAALVSLRRHPARWVTDPPT